MSQRCAGAGTAACTHRGAARSRSRGARVPVDRRMPTKR
jgi:hypothetical protein